MHSSCWALQPFQTKHQQFLLLHSSLVSCSAQPVWPHYVSFWLHIGKGQLLLSLTITGPLGGKNHHCWIKKLDLKCQHSCCQHGSFLSLPLHHSQTVFNSKPGLRWSVTSRTKKTHPSLSLSKLEHWATPESYWKVRPKLKSHYSKLRLSKGTALLPDQDFTDLDLFLQKYRKLLDI